MRKKSCVDDHYEQSTFLVYMENWVVCTVKFMKTTRDIRRLFFLPYNFVAALSPTLYSYDVTFTMKIDYVKEHGCWGKIVATKLCIKMQHCNHFTFKDMLEVSWTMHVCSPDISRRTFSLTSTYHRREKKNRLCKLFPLNDTSSYVESHLQLFILRKRAKVVFSLSSSIRRCNLLNETYYI